MKRTVGEGPGSSFDLMPFGDLKVTSILNSLYSNALGWIACVLLSIRWS